MGLRRRRAIRWIGGTLLILTMAAGAAWFWVHSLCQEGGAERVDSLKVRLGDRSVLGVFAHPDDELFVAGMLHDAARRPGGRVETVTLTRGEAGYYAPYPCRREDLPAIRTAELLRYGFFLGVEHQEVWDYKDGGVGDPAHEEEILRRLVGVMRKTAPDLVVTFDPSSGISLHEDHMAAGRLATRAAALAGDPAYAPDLLPIQTIRHLATVEAPRAMMRTLGGEVGRRVADVQRAPDYAIAVAPSIKTKAWDIHESQRVLFRKSYGIPAWLLYSLQDKEYYAVSSAESRPLGTTPGP